MFIRVKRRDGRRYAYLVASEWRPDVGSPRQKVIKYLGPADAVEADDVPLAARGQPAVEKWLLTYGTLTSPESSAALAATTETLKQVLLRGDRAASARVAITAIDEFGTWSFMERIAKPLLYEIGEEWHAGRLTVADEHIVTHGISDIVRQVTAAADTKKTRAQRVRVLLANPEGEQHSLGLALLECRLLDAGHEVIAIMGGLPRRDLVRRAREFGPDIIILSTTIDAHNDAALAAASDLRQAVPGARVVLGGQGWASPPADLRLPKGVALAKNATSAFAERLAAEVVKTRSAPSM